MYDPKSLEKKWQMIWKDDCVYQMPSGYHGKKFYVLGAWAYPSGDVHMGHVRNYTITDVIARFKRMNGFKVLNPVGWDAFGLPTENAALKRNLDPFTWNAICTKKMEEQFRSLGLSYDWSSTVDTSFPEYYKWTQWLIIRLWENKLLYKAVRIVNWCTSCETVLANEQVNDHLCERCGSEVVGKEMDQWFIRITDYAERLLGDMKLLTGWSPHILKMQENWIGKEDGGSMRLQDWCISRQRYWGAPIPFIECSQCGMVPVSEDSLPVTLPKGVDFSPGWPPPLARDSNFVDTECPRCGGKAKRVTEVMDTFVFSSYYYLRFVDPQNSRMLCDPSAEKYWMNVDLYVSGIELVNNHLIYARFFHKFLYDIGIVSSPEPFEKFFAQGMVLLGGEKMSKSKGNVISPVEIVDKYGADTLRTFILFVGPPEADVNWDDRGVNGCYRFLQRFYRIICDASVMFNKDWKEVKIEASGDEDMNIRSVLHNTLFKVTESMDGKMHFNTAIAALMEMTRSFGEYLSGSPDALIVSEVAEFMVKMISPFTPHLAQELWQRIGYSDLIIFHEWPKHVDELRRNDSVSMIVQINGKMKALIAMSKEDSMDQSKVEQAVAENQKISNLGAKLVTRVVFVPGKIINFVV